MFGYLATSSGSGFLVFSYKFCKKIRFSVVCVYISFSASVALSRPFLPNGANLLANRIAFGGTSHFMRRGLNRKICAVPTF